MINNNDRRSQYFRKEENYSGNEKPIILVDSPNSEMDSVVDISDRMPQSQSQPMGAMNRMDAMDDDAKDIITTPGQDLIGDEWINGSSIISDQARSMSEAAVNQVRQAIHDRGLSGNIGMGNNMGGIAMGRGGVTIEQIVRESVRPYLKTWVDHNLEMIVKEVMRRELARLG